ncbi:MAG: hypothetical protein ABI151_10000 [Chitinophagaceae bacterium]
MDEISPSENYERPRINQNIDTQRIISVDKFIILSILTFGLYEIWWIYKAWLFFKQKESNDTMPAVRAIFSIFFLYGLLQKILLFAQEKGYQKDFKPAELYGCFILTNFLSQLPQPYFLISLATFIFLLPPFRAFNEAVRNSPEVDVEEQQNFSLRHILMIVGGLFLWSSLLMGLSGGLGELPVK